MVIAFEEKDRELIEFNGVTIIEFKRRLYKLSEISNDALEILRNAICKLSKALNELRTRFLDVFDETRFMVEQAMESWNHPTSLRFRVVKILSKCTGIEKLKLWKMTRHTWLARNCC